MLCDYSHTKSESVAQIHTTMTEIQHFFLGDCFLLVHPVGTAANAFFCIMLLYLVFVLICN